MNKMFLNLDTDIVMTEKELNEFLFEIEVEELYDNARDYYSGNYNIDAQLENIKCVKGYDTNTTLNLLKDFGFNIEEITIDMLWEQANNSDNLDYIQDRLDTIYLIMKRNILDKGGR